MFPILRARRTGAAFGRVCPERATKICAGCSCSIISVWCARSHRALSGSARRSKILIQVGNIGLINALDRYNPSQGTRFSTYATPTILGEIKRHFRDKTAGIKVPRHLQELHLAVRRATQRLTQELGRTPTNGEIGLRLGVTEDEVETALECGEATNLLSLDTHFDSHAALDSASLLDLVGRIDKTLLEFETYGDLRKAMEALGPREREVIWLRFFDELSQAKIAKQLDISQMHVSRLQQRALKRLREMLSDDIRAVGGTPPPAKALPKATTTRRVRRCDG